MPTVKTRGTIGPDRRSLAPARRRHPVAPDAHAHHDHHLGDGLTTAVLDVRGLHWASEKAVIERTLGRLDGLHSVDANPVDQTATVPHPPGAPRVAAPRRPEEAR